MIQRKEHRELLRNQLKSEAGYYQKSDERRNTSSDTKIEMF